MKKINISVLTVALFAVCFAGCNYESPLVVENSVPVDAAILGSWETIPDEAKPSEDKYEALVLKFSDTEYSIQYPRQDKDSLYFRGYPIKVGGKTYIQIQLIGSEAGPVKDADRKYDVLSYTVSADTLVISTLNTKIVDKTISRTEGLLKAFLENKDTPELFVNTVKFSKVPAAKVDEN